MPDDMVSNKKVALYTGCFNNYYDPDVSEAAVRVLRRNDVEVVVPEQVCCGLPMMAKDNFNGAYKNIESNAGVLGKLVADGYVVASPCSSCSLFLKRDYPMLRDNELTRLVSRNTYHLTEYLLMLHNRGKLDLSRHAMPQTIFYLEPCHLRAQQLGDVSLDLLKLIPGLSVNYVSRVCCGQSGAYGWEKSNFQRSRRISSRLENELQRVAAERIVTDCGTCKLRLEALSGCIATHPILLLDEAAGSTD
ncbi:MAG: hypothetical protein EPO21_17395 [Chloroflexota bacterium]|nr:MAG: hypothetical protein EPO21_17395 [Chloroflexota bacterium]